MNKFSLLLSLSFFIASVADLQAYRGQEIVNKGLAKGKELFELVKNSRNAQIGLGVATGILVLTVVALKRKSVKGIEYKPGSRKEKQKRRQQKTQEREARREQTAADFAKTHNLKPQKK